MSDDPELLSSARLVLNKCREGGLSITTAESCTGGLIGSYLTAISGASDVFERGFITYSNQAKHDLLGVKGEDLEKFGAVSSCVAIAMAEGGLKGVSKGLCVAVTGIAGPGGGSDLKPVGLVYIACAGSKQKTKLEKHIFKGGRDDVRAQTVKAALKILLAQAVCGSQ